jgi:hypothetical protein
VLAPDGIRYLLGPSQVDGVGVAIASKDIRSGMGWIVDMTFTPNGSRAVDDLARQQFVSFGGRLVTSVPDEAAADAVLDALGR